MSKLRRGYSSVHTDFQFHKTHKHTQQWRNTDRPTFETHADGFDAPHVAEEDGDVDEHEQVADYDGYDIGFTLTIYLVNNRALEQTRRGRGRKRKRRKIIAVLIIRGTVTFTMS